MSMSAVALLGFASLTIILVLSLGGFRTATVLGGGRTANSFTPSGDDLEGFGKRLTRAHANCYENLPVAGAILLYAIATNQTAITDPLALIFLAARIGQSLVHLISTSNFFVLLRFALYAPQLAIMGYWLVRLFTAT